MEGDHDSFTLVSLSYFRNSDISGISFSVIKKVHSPSKYLLSLPLYVCSLVG